MKGLKPLSWVLMLVFGLLGASAAAASPSVLKTFRQHAPADTLTYWEGSLAAIPPSTWALAGSSQIEQLITQLHALKADLAPEPIEFLSTLLRDYATVLQESPNSLGSHYDLNADQDMAFYLDGLAPILHVAVNSPDRIRQLVELAAQDSNTPYKTQVWRNADVFVWDVVREPHIGFAIVFQPQQVTFGFYAAADTPTRTWRRFGLAPESDSVDSRGTLSDIQRDNGYVLGLMGFFDIQQLVGAMLHVAPSKTAADLALFSPKIAARQLPACQEEWQAVAAKMPLVTGGFKQLEKKSGQFLSAFSWHLDLANTARNLQLMTLNGHLPDYAITNQRQILSLALGLDSQALLPVVSGIWSAIAAADFSCPELQNLQALVGPMNLGTLAITTALLQGFQGMGMSLYDIAVSDTLPFGFSVDALVTLSSTQPALLAATLTALPQLQGIPFPTDDRPVPLTLWGLPEHLTPAAAIRGNHIAVYVGDRSQAAAKELSKEPLNHRGWMGAFVDTKRLHALLTEELMASPLITEAMDAAACVELQLAADALTSSDRQIAVRGAVDPQGLGFRVDQTQRLRPDMGIAKNLKGDYRLERLSDACRWVSVGEESLRSDGSGGYQLATPELGCVTWKSDYQWQQLGARIVFSESRAASRNSCETAFTLQEAVDDSCVIVGSDATGFRCLFQVGVGESELYRYVNQER